MERIKKIRVKRQYVDVNGWFDQSGYVRPECISWKDGRNFKIERILDFRPATTIRDYEGCDVYYVLIQGQEKLLFFERKNPHRFFEVGRWFVEQYTSE